MSQEDIGQYLVFFVLFVFLAAIFFLGYDAFVFLKTGTWESLTTYDILAWLNDKPFTITYEWKGVQKIITYIIKAPFSVVCLIIGILGIWVSTIEF